ncbi:MAG: zf-TFIIB domain-containing protein [Acidimicrobiales bacterium]
MNCPTCPESNLVMAERSGVEIDYCPTCRGVWLDRGELDKIIERDAPPPRREPERSDDRDRDRADDRRRYDNDDDWDDERSSSGGGRKRRKRESLLSELFDF